MSLNLTGNVVPTSGTGNFTHRKIDTNLTDLINRRGIVGNRLIGQHISDVQQSHITGIVRKYIQLQ